MNLVDASPEKECHLWVKFLVLFLTLFSASVLLAPAEHLAKGFQSPPHENRPATWFHLISGNVNREPLTTDLEAVSGAGFQGIQLFHGADRAWPAVQPQIQTLSITWDGMTSHVADEPQRLGRLGLRFTMHELPELAAWPTLSEPGNNEIEVRVPNSWHNRLSYYASLPKKQKKDLDLSGPQKGQPAQTCEAPWSRSNPRCSSPQPQVIF